MEDQKPNKAWRINFETGDSLVTEDEDLANLHRGKGRTVQLIDNRAKSSEYDEHG
jgi:hypothetical protein